MKKIEEGSGQACIGIEECERANQLQIDASCAMTYAFPDPFLIFFLEGSGCFEQITLVSYYDQNTE